MATTYGEHARAGSTPRTPLIGRAAELDRLRRTIARVAGGDPGIAVLFGLPGVGKTRLADEALDTAEAAGFAVFAGRCDAAGRDLAYAPFVQAFGAPLREMTEERRCRLVGDLPQLGLLIGGLGLAAPLPLGDPALERARLTEGFVRLVDRLARERPVALLVDDVHCADTGTTALLRHLLAGADQPVLVVCTAGTHEPGGADLITALAGTPLWVEHLDVEPLPASAARDLAGALLGASLDDELTAVIVERCAGRPMLIEAVTRTLAESEVLRRHDDVLGLRPGATLPLPTGVRAQLRLRLGSTSADEQALLRTLAIAGEAAVDELLDAVDLPPDRVLDALDQLERRGLLAATEPAAPYRLAHGLLRDTLLADLSPTATQRTHAALVNALRSRPGQQLRIADHTIAAGSLVPPDNALTRLRAGATYAARLGLTENVTRYLARGADIARSAGRTDSLLAVLTELGSAWQHLGEVARAAETWSEAAAAYAGRGDAIGVARAERELAMLAWTRGDIPAARERLDAAERSLAGLEPSGEHAWLWHARVVTGIRLGDVDAVGAAAARLRTLAGQLGSPSVAARAFLAEGALRYAGTDYVAAAEQDLRALDAAGASEEPLLALRAHDQLSVVAGAQLDLPGLRAHSEASVEVARRLGSLSLSGWPRCRLAVAELLSGDWESALRLNSELVTAVQQTGEQRGTVSMLATRGWILVRRGRLAAAREALERAHEVATAALRADRNIFAIVAIAELALALAEDDPGRALAHRPMLEDLTSGWLPLLGLTVLGEASIRCGDLDDGHRLAARLRAVRSCATVAPAALADWLDGLGAVAAGNAADGGRLLRSATSGFEVLGLPFEAARARFAAARSDPDPARAVQDGRATLAVFDRLGAAREAEQARSLLRSFGVSPSRGRARRPTGSQLSERELEVARLVATGLSNAEVATRLFISPRTVSTHLDRIYLKLDLGSRAALTRYLADSGLLDEAAAP